MDNSVYISQINFDTFATSWFTLNEILDTIKKIDNYTRPLPRSGCCINEFLGRISTLLFSGLLIGWIFLYCQEITINSAYAAMLEVHPTADLFNNTGATGISLINFIPAQINKKRTNRDTTDFPPSVFYMKAQLKHICKYFDGA